MPARTSERGIIGVCGGLEAGVWAKQQTESNRKRAKQRATTKCFMQTTHFPCTANQAAQRTVQRRALVHLYYHQLVHFGFKKTEEKLCLSLTAQDMQRIFRDI